MMCQMPKIWNVSVNPNSNIINIEIISPDDLKVKLTSPPHKGKANKQLICVLAKYFNVKKSNVNILKGQSSRNKIISIE